VRVRVNQPGHRNFSRAVDDAGIFFGRFAFADVVEFLAVDADESVADYRVALVERDDCDVFD